VDTPVLGPLRRRQWRDAATDALLAPILVPAYLLWKLLDGVER
jgi:hypothetical protein